MKNRAIILLLLLLFAWLTGISKTCAADDRQIEFAADHPPYLEDFVVSARDHHVYLSVKVANPFDHELKSLILNGVPQNITVTISVKVNRFNLYLVKFNRTIASQSYTHTITYDNLKKLFTVTHDHPGKTFECASFKEALSYATSFTDMALLGARQLEKNRSYQVETRAEIRKVRLPFHLEYLFFFLSAWDRKSNSYTIDIPLRLLDQVDQGRP
ncbi:MAG: DUF4390 domain-containing protein [Deltaproteobacteria bacterium]|nr:DUF4390 domain-containing protein [Deltaproteobacteria bacterium]